MGLLRKMFGRHARVEMEKVNDAVGMPLYVYLHRQYLREFDESTAMGLAAMITVGLVGLPPRDETSRQSLAVNMQLVGRKLNEIKNVPEICQIVSAFYHMRAKAADKSVPPDMVMLGDKLRKLGILLPIHQLQVPTSQQDLMRQVREFELWTKTF